MSRDANDTTISVPRTPNSSFDPSDAESSSGANSSSQSPKSQHHQSGIPEDELTLPGTPTTQRYEKTGRFDFEETKVRPKEFIPRPYLFVAEGVEVMPETTSQARMPPYWLLVDHMFAIIFCMCSPKFKEQPPLGLSQLTWALELLTSVKSRRGTYNKDVKVMISAIEDRILDCYVAIGKTTEAHESHEQSDSDKSGQKTKSPPFTPMTPRRQPSAPQFTPARRPPASPMSPAFNRASSPQDVRTAEEAKNKSRQDEPLTAGDEKEFKEFKEGLSLPLSPDQVEQRKVQKVTNFPPDRAAKSKTVSPGGHRVVSVTYEEVVARAPAVHETPTKLQGLKPRRLFVDDDSSDDPSKLQTSKSAAKATTPKMVSDNLVSFLVSWREEQVERLQVEMQRLDNIEQFMSKMDDTHERVLDEDAAKFLRELQLQPKRPGSAAGGGKANKTYQ